MRSDILRGAAAYGLSLAKAQIKAIPTHADITVTRRCTLDCPYCRATAQAGPEMSAEEILDAASVLYDLGNRYVSLTGGEPLLREDLPQILSGLSKRTRITSLLTNGTLLTEERLDELARSRLMSLGISVDGIRPSPEPKSCDVEFLEMVRRVSTRYGFKVTLMSTLKRSSCEETVAMIDRLTDMGFWVTVNLLMADSGSWRLRGNATELAFKEEDIPQLKASLDRLSRMKRVIWTPRFFERIPDYLRGQQVFDCCAGTHTLSIDCDGRVMPCVDLPPTEIHYTGLKEAFPLPLPKCRGCMWSCYFEESYRLSHPVLASKDLLARLFLPRFLQRPR